MTTRPYELLARFNSAGHVAGVSVRTITTANGREYESDPAPLSGVDDPAFAEFAEAFSASIVAQRDQLTTDLAAMTTERDQLTATLATRTSERDNALAQLDLRSTELQGARDALAEVRGDLTAMTSERDALLRRIDQLLTQIPWDPRIIDATAFLNRISPAELLDLTMSDDPVRQQIATMLKDYKSHDWPIMLDSPEMQQSIGYLAITSERAAELLRDSTQAEAYRAGS